MTPYPHQLEAAAWLDANPASPHRMLAADPGLGKTIEAILGADAVGASRILVVCPPVMRPVWRREIERWQEFPRQTRMCSTVEEVRRAAKKPRRIEWVIMGWFHAAEAHKSWPATLPFDVAVLDEAHYAKSPDAARTRGVYGKGCKGNGLVSRAARVWLLTGTPVLNGPHELWPHYRALWPDALGTERPYSYAGFKAEFCDVQADAIGQPVRGVKRGKAPVLKAAFVDSHILRQRKADVMKDMPALTLSEVPLLIGAADRHEVQRLAKERGLFDATLDQVQAVLDDADATYLATLRRHLGHAKAAAAADLILNDLEGGTESAVVFAWHRDTLDALAKLLEPAGVLRLDGSVSMTERDVRVQRFQAHGPERIVLAQITAAGVGITLTRAADVYMVEQAWTPAENAQAIQRCHRIGQNSPVLARFLYAEGTVDALLAAVLARKARTITSLGLD